MDSIFDIIISSHGPTLPIVTDELSALECISIFSGMQVTSLEECVTGSIPGVYLYQKLEDKNQLSADQVREWIRDLSEKPYEGKIVTILRDFDEIDHKAMNVSLKTLEEPPSYAIILLIVKNPELLIETIRSRTLTYFRAQESYRLEPSVRELVKRFFQGDIPGLTSYLMGGKIEADEAIALLMDMSQYARSDFLIQIEGAIEALTHVHETPRNILDQVILNYR